MEKLRGYWHLALAFLDAAPVLVKLVFLILLAMNMYFLALTATAYFFR